MARFVATFRPTSTTRIVDIGGTDLNWRILTQSPELVLANIEVPADQDGLPGNLRYVVADGCALPFPDASFDIAFSNSTIEHVHTLDRQRAFASEVRRVGRGVWLQTPARSFPFEPHWLGLFIHWLPKRWQRRVARNGTIYGLAFRPSQEQVDALIDEYRLLSFTEMQELFPDCEIRRERFLLLTKSFVAVRSSDGAKA